MTDINDILADREKGYGNFEDLADIAQVLKAAFRALPGWANLRQDQREALDMIAVKLGRIMNGNPNYPDSWVDIAGYAMLVANRLMGIYPTEVASVDRLES